MCSLQVIVFYQLSEQKSERKSGQLELSGAVGVGQVPWAKFQASPLT